MAAITTPQQEGHREHIVAQPIIDAVTRINIVDLIGPALTQPAAIRGIHQNTTQKTADVTKTIQLQKMPSKIVLLRPEELIHLAA